MPYNPSPEVARILNRAKGYVDSAPYRVTARWVFYRLLQDGTLATKQDYKRLLSYSSKARKEWWNGWAPDMLADDTRQPNVRGSGFDTEAEWLRAVQQQLSCTLDHWGSQRNYVEVWFEAAAMQSQFQHYCDPNISLLAFHGDVSIPAKWDATVRLVNRWRELPDDGRIIVLYYGDLDPKGISIPEAAERDVRRFASRYIIEQEIKAGRRAGDDRGRDRLIDLCTDFSRDFEFSRIALNESHITEYDIPDNPERPGTWQWEAVPDEAAEELIGTANQYLDTDSFGSIEDREEAYTQRVRSHLQDFEHIYGTTSAVDRLRRVLSRFDTGEHLDSCQAAADAGSCECGMWKAQDAIATALDSLPE